MEQSLPHFSGPVSHLRHGFNSLESAMNAPHPVAVLERTSKEAEWSSKMEMVRRTYGAHMAMRLATERVQFGRLHRLPGLASQGKNIALETCMGTDTKIDFADFLNDPQLRPSAPKVTMHTVMETNLGVM